jgi:hypothetical protein
MLGLIIIYDTFDSCIQPVAHNKLIHDHIACLTGTYDHCIARTLSMTVHAEQMS